MSATRCASGRRPPKNGSRCGRANAGLMTICSRRSMTSCCSFACPHHHVATLGSFNSSPSRCRHSPGRKASNAGLSARPEPRALATVTCPARAACTSPGTPRNESLRNSTGSQNVSSTRRRMTSTGCNPSSVFRKTR